MKNNSFLFNGEMVEVLGVFKIRFSVCWDNKCRELEGLVDTGVTLTKVPRSVLKELGIKPVAKRKFELGDGREIERDIGFAIIKVRIDAKEYSTACPVAFGEDKEEPLIGAVTLEGMGLGVDPLRKRLVEITFLEK